MHLKLASHCSTRIYRSTRLMMISDNDAGGVINRWPLSNRYLENLHTRHLQGEGTWIEHIDFGSNILLCNIRATYSCLCKSNKMSPPSKMWWKHPLSHHIDNREEWKNSHVSFLPTLMKQAVCSSTAPAGNEQLTDLSSDSLYLVPTGA